MEYEQGNLELTKRGTQLRKANVCTIPPACDFLATLVDALYTGMLVPGFQPKANDAFALLDCTIYVPNRRAARGLANAFMDRSGDSAILLPAIRTLGDVDDDEFGLGQTGRDVLEMVQPISDMERHLVLSRFVERWLERISDETRTLYANEDIHVPASQADAIRLAEDLTTLMDQVALEEIDWRAVNDIVPMEHAKWWELTGTFLQIIMTAWPDFLEEKGRTDPALHRAKLLSRRVEALRTEPPRGPVIIAGSTGSVPSTRRLLQQVASMEQGAIVLPGVDLTRDKSEWRAILHRPDLARPLSESHPQYGLAVLLIFLGVEPEHLRQLGEWDRSIGERARLVAEAMTPSDMTPNWFEKLKGVSQEQRTQAFANVSVMETKNERVEATAIAIALREVLNEPSKTAALVTSDRKLARRVSNELMRFGIQVDDTAGAPLASTQAATLVRQLVSFTCGDGGPLILAALVRNKLCTCSLEPEQAENAANAFEHLALRGIVNPPGPGDFHAWLEHRLDSLINRPRTHKPAVFRRMKDTERNSLLVLARTLDDALLPLKSLHEHKEALPMVRFVEVLETACDLLTRNAHGGSSLSSANGTGGLQAFFEELKTQAAAHYSIQSGSFAPVFEALLEGRTARDVRKVHPRLHIYGPLEVRLIHQDRVILAGMNEGTWPGAQRNDAFLNRTMREAIGMDSPERRIGLSAHDFQQLMGRHEVILTRSSKVDRAPSVASRWLQRMEAVLGESCWKEMRLRGERYARLAMLLDRPDRDMGLCQAPAPTPPVDHRPSELSVSDVEDWIRDPYKLYAKRILDLNPLAPLTRQADSALQGTVYHGIMDEYIKREFHLLEDENERINALKDLATTLIGNENLDPDVERKWCLRFHTVVEEYCRWESDKPSKHVYTETGGEAYYGDTNFTVSARADRLDLTSENTVRIQDYKTSKNPAKKEAKTISPQLLLEGSIALRGGFPHLPNNVQVEDLRFLRMLKDGAFHSESLLDKANPDPTDVIKQAEHRLEGLIAAYEEPTQPYHSRRAPGYSSPYDHLARVAEWSYGEEDAEGSNP